MSGSSMSVIGVVTYITGWGPILSIGFLFGGAAAIEAFGSRATWPCLAWTTVVVVLGQAAIATHVAPSMFKEPDVQGVGALGLVGALLIIELLGRVAARRENSGARAASVRAPLQGAGLQLLRHHRRDRPSRDHAVREPGLRADPRSIRRLLQTRVDGGVHPSRRPGPDVRRVSALLRRPHPGAPHRAAGTRYPWARGGTSRRPSRTTWTIPTSAASSATCTTSPSCAKRTSASALPSRTPPSAWP